MGIFDGIQCALWETTPYFWQAVAGVNAARRAGAINSKGDCQAAAKIGSAIAQQFDIPDFLGDSFGQCVCDYVFNGGSPNPPPTVQWNYKQVAYVGTDGHVWELTCNAGTWSPGDLTAATGAPPPAAGSPLTSYIWNNYKQVAYVGTDGHVWELTCNAGTWSPGDLTAATGAPPPAAGSPLTSYIWNNYKQVAYVGTDGHVWELTCNAGTWSPGDLTALTGAPAPGGGSSLTSYIWNDGAGQDPRVSAKQVAFESSGGALWELTCVAGNWTKGNLTTIAGAPAAVPRAPLTSYIWS
jgi:hypothetical protein